MPPGFLNNYLMQSRHCFLYCRSGRRSKEAAEKLCSLGYTNVYEFGGIIDWNGEIVTGEDKQESNTAKMEEDSGMKEIYLAEGCFWGLQKYFDQFDGVVKTEVGYANGLLLPNQSQKMR